MAGCGRLRNLRLFPQSRNRGFLGGLINSITPVVFPYSITMNVEFFRFTCTVLFMLCGKFCHGVSKSTLWLHSYDYWSQLRSYPCNLLRSKIHSRNFFLHGPAPFQPFHALMVSTKGPITVQMVKVTGAAVQKPFRWMCRVSQPAIVINWPRLFLKLFRLWKIYSM